jgi:hypothetical protein
MKQQQYARFPEKETEKLQFPVISVVLFESAMDQHINQKRQMSEWQDENLSQDGLLL